MRIHANPDPYPGQLDFDTTNTLYVSICDKTYETYFERLEIRFISKFWSFSLLLDPDQHSQYGSGSKGAKSMRIRIRNTAINREKIHSDLISFGVYCVIVMFVLGRGCSNIYENRKEVVFLQNNTLILYYHIDVLII